MTDNKTYPPNHRLIDLRVAVEDLLGELMQPYTGIACYENHSTGYMNRIFVTVSYGDISIWQSGGHSVTEVVTRLRAQIENENGGGE